MTEAADDSLGAGLYTVAVRLPPFWTDRPTRSVVRPGRGAVRPGRHHATEDKIQPRCVSTPPATRCRGRGHHHVPTRTRALRPAESRAGAPVVHLTRAACKTTPVTRGNGRSKAIPVTQAPQATFQMTSYALSGLAASRHTSRPYSLARPRAAWILPRTSLKEFARLRHSLPLQASRLPCPTTLADCWSSWKSSRAKWLPCVRPKHADAPTLLTTAATPLATHLFVTSAGTTNVSGTMAGNQPPVFTPAGKLHQQSLRAANVCSTNSGRLFITDRVHKQGYLVDTGSYLCVFPRKLLPGRRERTDYTLFWANGTTISTYGWISQSLKPGTAS